MSNGVSGARIAGLRDLNPGWIHLSGAFDSLYRHQLVTHYSYEVTLAP